MKTNALWALGALDYKYAQPEHGPYRDNARRVRQHTIHSGSRLTF